jgi:hypothetical protein
MCFRKVPLIGFLVCQLRLVFITFNIIKFVGETIIPALQTLILNLIVDYADKVPV